MGLFEPQTYDMAKDKDRYTFSHRNSAVAKVEGTPKEIAYKIFSSYMDELRDDPWPSGWHTLGPFSLQVSGLGNQFTSEITTDWLAKIEPNPELVFWEELNANFTRLINLAAFA